jgi:photosystem II stability/assembly factor-like uncharacterized protein
MSPSWRFTHTDTTSSLVGVDVVNREIVWAVGPLDIPEEPDSPGVVVRTVNRGQSWENITPPGGAELVFHDVEAFDHNHALALAVPISVGSESQIYRTADGGAHWDVTSQGQVEPEDFYDGLAFFGHHRGLAVGDPVEGKFRILTTHDGGHSWQHASPSGMPPPLAGEGVRATGTSLVARRRHNAWFGTQPEGPNSRVFHTHDAGHTWSAVTTPIPGRPEFGIASFAFRDAQHGLALGGSGPDSNAPSTVAATADGGTTWSQVGSPAGFRLSIAWVRTHSHDTFVAVGPSGSDFSTDDGHTWHLFDETDLRGINCRNASCWAVGKNGLAAELMP